MKKINYSLKFKMLVLFIFFALVLYLVFWLSMQLSLTVFYRTAKIKKAKELTTELVTVVEGVDVSKRGNFYIYEEVFRDKIQNAEADAWVLYYDHRYDSLLVGYSNIYVMELPEICTTMWKQYSTNQGSFKIKENNTYIVGETTRDELGRTIMVLVRAEFQPFAATQDVFTNQFLFLSLIIGLMALLFVITIQHQVVKPITSLTISAKSLAKGNFDTKFNAEGFDEIEELSDTLNYAAGELSKLELYQKDLMMNVSHDLRTPLTLISGYGEMMKDFPSERTEDNLQIIIDESKRLNGLVNDILLLTKMDMDAQNWVFESYNLTENIKEIVYRMEKMVEELNIDFIFDYENEVNIVGNMDQMNKVLYNFISNAINYIGDDKMVIVKQIVKDDYVTISVIDHGKGIPKDEIQNVWQRYYKAKNHIRASVGSGLGLSIVRGVLEKHGFEYGVNSEEGKGSEFWFKAKIDK